jgi:hypothetical protein
MKGGGGHGGSSGIDSLQTEGAWTVAVYYEARKRELNRRLIYECWCDERLKAKAEGSTRLAYTGTPLESSVFLFIMNR